VFKLGYCTRERHLIVCCTDEGRQRTESFLFAGLPQHLVHFKNQFIVYFVSMRVFIYQLNLFHCDNHHLG